MKTVLLQCSTSQEEEAVKEAKEPKNVVDVSLMTQDKSIEGELSLPLDTKTKDLQVISSYNPIRTISDVSTQHSLNVSENKKAPKKSPNRKIPREERNNKNSKIFSKEESKSSSKKQNEQYVSSVDASEGHAMEKNAINLLEVTQVVLHLQKVLLFNGKCLTSLFMSFGRKKRLY